MFLKNKSKPENRTKKTDKPLRITLKNTSVCPYYKSNQKKFLVH
ncbi:hypothetical protein K8P02_11370 [Bacteroides nordii]|nr:hypothetical protein K8P02_11370 [Bacteroides nordii]